MKNTMKLMIVLTFLCGSVIADDGNQGSGGRTCNPEVDPTCTIANPGGNGGDDVFVQNPDTFGEIVFGVIENVLYLIR